MDAERDAGGGKEDARGDPRPAVHVRVDDEDDPDHGGERGGRKPQHGPDAGAPAGPDAGAPVGPGAYRASRHRV